MHSLPRLPRLALALALAIAAAQPQALHSQQGSTFELELALSRSPSEVILEYSRDIAEIAQPDPTPFLRIYGDGRYVVHYPVYMKKRGDWEGRIDSAELEGLVRRVAEARILDLDSRALKQQLRATRVARQKAALQEGRPVRLYEVSDRESVRLRVRLESYKPAGVLGIAGSPVDREIVWWGLREDLVLHPDVEVLRNLAAIEADLRALAEAPGLARLEGEVR